MLTRKGRKIKNLEAMIKGRDVLIKKLETKIDSQKEENLALYQENKDLRFENEEQLDLIRKIEQLVNSNNYSNERAILNKIRELSNTTTNQLDNSN